MDNNIAQKILDKELENIVKKVASGKTLTSSERLLIDKHYNKDKDVSNKYIFLKHGKDASQYFALESNPITRNMYAKYGINSQSYADFFDIF